MDFSAASQSSSSTSISLIDRLKDRDTDAWRRLTDLYGPLVYYWCRKSGLRPQDTVDVCQEVFAAVATGIGGFRGLQNGGSFRGWLWTITRNKVRDFFRKQCGQENAAGGTSAQIEMMQVPDEASNDERSDEDHVESVALFHRGLEAVRAEFEHRTWEAFWRVTIDGHATVDVAADLGITANGVRQAKSRVLRRLREELGEAS